MKQLKANFNSFPTEILLMPPNRFFVKRVLLAGVLRIDVNSHPESTGFSKKFTTSSNKADLGSAREFVRRFRINSDYEAVRKERREKVHNTMSMALQLLKRFESGLDIPSQFCEDEKELSIALCRLPLLFLHNCHGVDYARQSQDEIDPFNFASSGALLRWKEALKHLVRRQIVHAADLARAFHWLRESKRKIRSLDDWLHLLPCEDVLEMGSYVVRNSRYIPVEHYCSIVGIVSREIDRITADVAVADGDSSVSARLNDFKRDLRDSLKWFAERGLRNVSQIKPSHSCMLAGAVYHAAVDFGLNRPSDGDFPGGDQLGRYILQRLNRLCDILFYDHFVLFETMAVTVCYAAVLDRWIVDSADSDQLFRGENVWMKFGTRFVRFLTIFESQTSAPMAVGLKLFLLVALQRDDVDALQLFAQNVDLWRRRFDDHRLRFSERDFETMSDALRLNSSKIDPVLSDQLRRTIDRADP